MEWLAVVIGIGIVAYLIGQYLNKPKITGDALAGCLSFFEAQNRIIAFQSKEAELYNNVLTKCLDSVGIDSKATREATRASERLLAAAEEVLRRHDELEDIPDDAVAVRHAWHVVFTTYLSWAKASKAGIEAKAEGLTPNVYYIQQLVQEREQAQRIAEEEDKKFVKQLDIGQEDFTNMVNRSIEAGSKDDWEPS